MWTSKGTSRCFLARTCQADSQEQNAVQKLAEKKQHCCGLQLLISPAPLSIRLSDYHTN